MAQFDIHRNADKDGARIFPYLIDIQHPLHRQFDSRIVIPLTLPDNLGKHVLPHLNPLISVGGKDFAVLTQQLSSIPMSALGPKVTSAAAQREAIVAALDFLISGIQ